MRVMTDAIPAKAYVALLVLSVAFAGPALAAPRAALVIGNASYAHAPALSNPLNDAADVGAALERLGFEVTRLENAGQAALRRGLQEFSLAASASEVAVVFYAGHGIEVDRRNFLVPVDARLASDQDVEFEAVPLELVSRAVERASGLRLVILDACRENPFAVSMQRAGATRSIGRGLARVEPSGETLVAYAAKEGTVAADGAGRNSPYSEALLGQLEEPGLEVGLMFRRVRDAVLAATGGRQEPFVYGSLSSRGVYLAAKPAPSPVTGAVTGVSAPDSPGSHRVTAAHELLFWESVKDSEHAADIEAYLDRYPGGAYEILARNRLERLERASEEPEPSVPTMAAAPAPSLMSARVEAERLAAEREFWTSVKSSSDPGELQAYLDRYPDGAYAVLARRRLKRLEIAGPDAAQAEPVVAVRTSAPGTPVSSVPASGPARLDPQELESSLGLERAERRRVQAGLASLGYGPGPADGLFGARTREAIRRYQAAKGFETTGYLTSELSEALQLLGGEAQAEKRRQEERSRTAEAERRAAARRADDAAFAEAKRLHTPASYRMYLDRGGRHESEASVLLTEVSKPKWEVGQKFRDCPGCPELVVVPSGSFMMGSPSGEEGRDGDEGPLHRVSIAEPFAVGVYEVTFAEWDACRRGGGCTHHAYDRGWGRGSRPVIHVSWEDAKSYVRWLSLETGARYRLLSESEWEYVARAGTRTRYHWGDGVGRGRANCAGCGSRWDDERTAPVGSFSANGFGLHDVHGNVREWVEDCWQGSYAGAPGDGGVWTSGGSCSWRVLRGGSWNNLPGEVRSANRYWIGPGYRFGYVGFRVARTLN